MSVSVSVYAGPQDEDSESWNMCVRARSRAGVCCMCNQLGQILKVMVWKEIHEEKIYVLETALKNATATNKTLSEARVKEQTRIAELQTLLDCASAHACACTCACVRACVRVTLWRMGRGERQKQGMKARVRAVAESRGTMRG